MRSIFDFFETLIDDIEVFDLACLKEMSSRILYIIVAFFLDSTVTYIIYMYSFNL